MSSRTSSDEPPPMSNRIAPRRVRVEQRQAAGDRQHRFGLAVDHLEADAELAVDPLAKIVAVRRPRGRLRSQSAASAPRAWRRSCRGRCAKRRARGRSPASEIRPVWAMPSPSRMMREKESTMRNPPSVGRAISSRQLLVPRSSAAYAVSYGVAAGLSSEARRARAPHCAAPRLGAATTPVPSQNPAAADHCPGGSNVSDSGKV